MTAHRDLPFFPFLYQDGAGVILSAEGAKDPAGSVSTTWVLTMLVLGNHMANGSHARTPLAPGGVPSPRSGQALRCARVRALAQDDTRFAPWVTEMEDWIT